MESKLTANYEIMTSQYNDPDQKAGQHTNGPANIFVREDASCPWYVVDRSMVNSKHKVKSTIEQIGVHAFQSKYCTRIVD